jgi:hypothetical protein
MEQSKERAPLAMGMDQLSMIRYELEHYLRTDPEALARFIPLAPPRKWRRDS